MKSRNNYYINLINTVNKIITQKSEKSTFMIKKYKAFKDLIIIVKHSIVLCS